MKKKYLFGMALMASLAFNSCTKEIVIVQEGNGLEEVQQDGQVLTLQVSNSGDGLTTRAGRPLLSSQAKQDINTIVLYVVEGHELDNEINASTGKKVVLKKTISADEWANALDYSTNGHGKQLQISFKGSENQKLDNGNYTIYAVGYKHVESTCVTNYDITDDTKFGVSADIDSEEFNSGSSVTLAANSFSAVFASGKTTADEIFAGKVEVTATSDGHLLKKSSTDKKDIATLVLNRQVAGVTGYFTNIPAKVGEYVPTHIRLVASGKSNKVHFTSMVNGETDEAATSGTSGVTSVVNGSWDSSNSNNQTPDAPYWANSGTEAKENKGYMVYDIELSEFFPLIGKNKQSPATGKYTFADMDLDGDGFVGYKDAQYYVYNYTQNNSNSSIFSNGEVTEGALNDWSTAIKGGNQTINSQSDITCQALSTFWENPNDYQTLVAGSVFAGEFIIPFLQSAIYNTFELQLIYKDNSNKTYILKNWNVQVPDTDMVSGGSADSNIADGITATWTNDSKLKYNIYRNHLYSLGMKTTDIEDGVDPDPKPEPDPDPDPDPEDKPEDLSKGQDLLLNVNDNWEIIHEMEID